MCSNADSWAPKLNHRIRESTPGPRIYHFKYLQVMLRWVTQRQHLTKTYSDDNGKYWLQSLLQTNFPCKILFSYKDCAIKRYLKIGLSQAFKVLHTTHLPDPAPAMLSLGHSIPQSGTCLSWEAGKWAEAFVSFRRLRIRFFAAASYQQIHEHLLDSLS